VKLTIGKKIFFGYLPLIVVIVLITSLALYRLNQVHVIFNDVVDVDIKLSKSADEMIDALRDRESTVMRYLILQSEDMHSLMVEQAQEYEQLFKDLGASTQSSLYEKLVLEYKTYKMAEQRCIDSVSIKETVSGSEANELRSNAFVRQGKLLKLIKVQAEQQQQERTENAVTLFFHTFRMIMGVAVIGLILALTISFFMTESILKSVQQLKKAVSLISKGVFKNLPSVNSSDEVGELSHSFNKMAHRLIELEEAYRDASPLTRLPGGITIESVVQSRIDDEIPFAFCMLDLDNFKPFNDRYGYSRGNVIIKQTAKILQAAIKAQGSQNDFVGHVGGDDFVVVTRPDRFEKICETIIEMFDADILSYYDKEDCQSGRIISKNRLGKAMEFPIMTISISAVNSEFTELKDYIQVGEIVAELKTYAKSFNGSNLVVDRRIKK
jgi:GGDEF domain-containing protein